MNVPQRFVSALLPRAALATHLTFERSDGRIEDVSNFLHEPGARIQHTVMHDRVSPHYS